MNKREDKGNARKHVIKQLGMHDVILAHFSFVQCDCMLHEMVAQVVAVVRALLSVAGFVLWAYTQARSADLIVCCGWQFFVASNHIQVHISRPEPIDTPRRAVNCDHININITTLVSMSASRSPGPPTIPI